MKNIHILPTDKPSRLYLTTKEYIFEKEYSLSTDECQNKHIYITSDETAYPYALHLKKQEVLKIKGVGENSGELYHDKGFSYPYECQKIILTTDQDLIKDGVQAIDDEFLEWFVKNPNCEKVEVIKFHGINTSIAEVNSISGDGSLNWQGITDLRDYKIIIPERGITITQVEKKTAVEWFENSIKDLIPNDIGSQLKFKNKIEQAKEMEKQQNDKFAIKFAEWLNTLEAKYLIEDLILVGELNKNPKTKELLKIFKNK